MRSVLLYLHLGLGDQLMCHGIVREYCKKHDTVTILASPPTYESVLFMYRDLQNITIVSCTHIEAPAYLMRHGSEYTEVKKIGFERLDRKSGEPIEKQFYALAVVDLEKKWSNFYVQRDLHREHELYTKIAPKRAYVFLHEDRPRDFIVDRKKIMGTYEVFDALPAQTENIFDYCTIIANAAEILVIDSSFMFLIDCLKYEAPGQKLYVHRYARPNSDWHLPILKKNWIILGTNRRTIPRKIGNLLRRIARDLRTF